MEGLVYEEKIISKINLVIFLIIDIFLIFLLFIIYPQGNMGATVIVIATFIFIIFININFIAMIIKITPDYLLISFGLFKKKLPWREISSCRIDDRPIIKYGGWGIRMAKIKGTPVIAYILEKTPRVVLSLKNGKYKEFVFSTNNPEDVINIINQKIELYK